MANVKQSSASLGAVSYTHLDVYKRQPPEFSIIYKLLHHLNLDGRREVSMSLCKACGQPLVFPTHLAQTEKAFVRPKRAFMAI